MEDRGILLKSGTNEVEIAEFIINGQSFGVNVAKIREFVPFERSRLTTLAGAPPSIRGMFLIRGQTVPLIDLAYHLELKKKDADKTDSDRDHVVVIIEFNRRTNSFLADAISKIHRVSWSNFRPLNPFLVNAAGTVTGSINIDNREIMILDMENIIGEIFPETLVNYQVAPEESEDDDRPRQREEIKVVMAEDSAVIRTHMVKLLDSSGYKKVQAFENGALAWKAISGFIEQARATNRPIRDFIDILISDIEMPEMDGLTLCKNVKTDPISKVVPVVMFSSLITDQMAIKCRSVGADACCTKPQTAELVAYVDQFGMAGSTAD